MPYPLMPAGKSSEYENLFPKNHENISEASRYFSNESEDEQNIQLLEKIDRHQDMVVAAATEYISGNIEEYYRVPESISDHLLLKLKTLGYCSGTGRLVKFSEKAKNLLKKRYLSSDNNFKSQRVKKKII